jgi:hypothetical protein
MAGLAEAAKRMATTLYNRSPRELLERRGTPSEREVTQEFLRSQEYVEHMMRHVPCDGDYGLHEAQTLTRSFLHRHQEVQGILGAFRWRGFQERLDEILEVITMFDPVIDFGGAAGPIGLGTEIVDSLELDRRGKPVRYHRLTDLPSAPGAVISSHTFEHIPNLSEVIDEVATSLKPNGVLIAHVPCFTCDRWRAGTHANPRYGDHVWTFGLSGTEPSVPLNSYTEIDNLIGARLAIESAAFVGDDSILVVARK